jgi:hypothetical protein
MTMTQLGKTLVFVNLALSLAMAAWALGIYTGRVDWSGKGGPGAAKGEFGKRQDDRKALFDALNSSEPRHQEALAYLQRLEHQRPGDAAFYKQELAHNANTANDAAPARAVNATGGQIALGPDKDGVMRPQMVPVKGLRSMAAYTTELRDTYAAIVEEIGRYQQLVQKDNELTDQLIGPKGLRQLVFNEEDVKQKRIQAEMETLKPLLINALAESDLLRKRQRALVARVKELDSAGARTTSR